MHMEPNADGKQLLSISIELTNPDGKSEFLVVEGLGPEDLRISRRTQGQELGVPLHLSEDDLVILLEKAIRAGLISKDFLHRLHAEFEI